MNARAGDADKDAEIRAGPAWSTSITIGTEAIAFILMSASSIFFKVWSDLLLWEYRK
jgi:hypothetical protein